MNVERQEYWVFRVMVRRRVGPESQPRGATLLEAMGTDTLTSEGLERWWLPEDKRPPTMPDARELRRLFEAGAIFEMPDGALAEPMEVFTEEAQAREHAAKLKSERELAEFRVVLAAGDTL